MKTKNPKPALSVILLIIILLINSQDIFCTETQDESGQAKGKKITIEVLPPEDDDPLDAIRDSSEPNKSFGIEDLGGLIEKVTRNHYYPYLPGVPNQAYMSQYYMPNMIGYPFTGAPVGGMPRFRGIDSALPRSGNSSGFAPARSNDAIDSRRADAGEIEGRAGETKVSQTVLEGKRALNPQLASEQAMMDFISSQGSNMVAQSANGEVQKSMNLGEINKRGPESGFNLNRIENGGTNLNDEGKHDKEVANSNTAKPASKSSLESSLVTAKDSKKKLNEARFLEIKLSQALQKLNQLTEEAKGISLQKGGEDRPQGE